MRAYSRLPVYSLSLVMSLLTLACSKQLAKAPAKAPAQSLQAARRGHATHLVRRVQEGTPLGEPASPLFDKVTYTSPVGELAGWLSAPTREMNSARYPAIIWVTGGLPVGGIDEDAWEPVSEENDQSAKAYREEGIVMFYPTFRGADGNPGYQELFYGEVDDLLAALAYLKTVPYVDPDRIYLGGHSTGATLMLLAAASSPDCRAVIALGPTPFFAVAHLEPAPFDTSDKDEMRLRDPRFYLDTVGVPLFIIEGDHGGNTSTLRAYQAATKNPLIHFFVVPGFDHFTLLAPLNRLLAARISGLGEGEPLSLSEQELARLKNERH